MMRTVSTPKLPLWKILLNLPQTYFIVIGTFIGYLGLIFSQGLRAIVLIIGGIITLMIGVAWFLTVQQLQSSWNHPVSLLDPELFQTELAALEGKLAGQSFSSWENFYQWTWEIHHFSQQIADHEPELIPDLIETLYTVLSLVEQGVAACLTLKKVQTESYKILAQNYLKGSYKRLQQTHHQLQQLRDQVVFAQLSEPDLIPGKVLPERLQILIAENKTALQPVNRLQ